MARGWRRSYPTSSTWPRPPWFFSPSAPGSSAGEWSKEIKVLRFFSDNTGSASPEILTALAAANQGLVPAYGNDAWTRKLDDCLSAYFAAPLRAFPVATGTAANSLSIATLSPSYGVVFAHEEAHIANDEAGAPGFFTA